MWSLNTIFPIKLALGEIKNLEIRENNAAYQELLNCAKGYADRYQKLNIGQIPGVEAARELFHSIGLDPTKRRPSSEALLRRALKNKDMYSINPLVDLGNWCSLEFLLPICVYDANKIKGDVNIRLGKEGESYLGHNNREVNLSGRFTIADASGPFGSPMTDSVRTAVYEKTKQAILTIFAPGSYSTELLNKRMHVFLERAINFCNGEIIKQEILE